MNVGILLWKEVAGLWTTPEPEREPNPPAQRLPPGREDTTAGSDSRF